MSTGSHLSTIIDDLLKSNFTKNVMKDAMSHVFAEQLSEKDNILKADVIQNSDLYVILMDIPGVDKNDIICDIETINYQNILQVKASRYTYIPDYEVVAQERYSGEMHKEIELPNIVDKNTINAKYDNGVLKITFSKLHTKKSIPIM